MDQPELMDLMDQTDQPAPEVQRERPVQLVQPAHKVHRELMALQVQCRLMFRIFGAQD
jgi:hypothetical protein